MLNLEREHVEGWRDLRLSLGRCENFYRCRCQTKDHYYCIELLETIFLSHNVDETITANFLNYLFINKD
jgi:hypothetical protein